MPTFQKINIPNKVLSLFLQIVPVVTLLSASVGLMEARFVIPAAIVTTPILMYLAYVSSSRVRIISNLNKPDEREVIIKDRINQISSRIFFGTTIILINLSMLVAYYNWLEGSGLEQLNFGGQNSVILILLLITAYFYHYLLPWSVALWTEDSLDTQISRQELLKILTNLGKLSAGFVIFSILYVSVFVTLGRQQKANTQYNFNQLIEAIGVSGNSEITIIEDSNLSGTVMEIKGSKWQLESSSFDVVDYIAYGPQTDQDSNSKDIRELSLGLSTASTLNHFVFGDISAIIRTPKITAVNSFYGAKIKVKSVNGCLQNPSLRLFAQTEGTIEVDCFDGKKINVIEYRIKKDQNLIKINQSNPSVDIETYIEPRN